jgi:16S rRNA C967 or C1407 C5-methylase (RsmB/RsmF family)/NOL1/NOP2/fmu family ribosome biogenesis protein
MTSLMNSIPKEFMNSLVGIEGFDAAAFEQAHTEIASVVSVRLNPMKWPLSGVAGSMDHRGEGPKAGLPGPAAGGIAGGLRRVRQRVPWSSYGYYLEERPSFTFDPLFHAGVYYVQEASSMFLEQALKQTLDLSRPLKVLDLCAAPGGKSTLIQSLLTGDSLLVSNEVIRSRAAILEENIVKWGAANVIITQNDPRDFQRMENYFDLLVVDAPCSGSGLFRREPEAIGEWSLDNVRLCNQRQQRILADCWPALKQEGVLVYCTCSYSKEEDEDILDWLIEEFKAEPLPLAVEEGWRIVETVSKRGGLGYRFYPDKLEGEGFFIAALRKKGGADVIAPRGKRTGGAKQPGDRLTRAEEVQVRKWVRDDLALGFFRHNGHLYAFPERLGVELAFVQSSCYLKKAGVMAGMPTAKDLIPEHELALSKLTAAGLPVLDLSKEQAIHYLRKEEIVAGAGQKGWTLVRYEEQNLGWAKILPTRVNNYYPASWRILKRER